MGGHSGNNGDEMWMIVSIVIAVLMLIFMLVVLCVLRYVLKQREECELEMEEIPPSTQNVHPLLPNGTYKPVKNMPPIYDVVQAIYDAVQPIYDKVQPIYD